MKIVTYRHTSIYTTVLASVIKDTLICLNLFLSRACGQCYDGANNMCGAKNGVAKLIQNCEPKAILTHTLFEFGQ